LLIYLTGSAVTFLVLLHRIPGGWSEVTQVAAAAGHKLQLLDFSWNLATKYTFWSGLIGGAFLTMATHGTDQIIVQRLLAAKNERDSRRALLTSGVIVLFQFTVFLLIGVFLYVFAQHSPLLVPGERTDRILPLFLLREMPVGLAGLLLASIVAVAMSNASGSLNSLAASSVLDFAKLRGQSADPARFLRLSRGMTLAWGLVLMGFGLVKWGPAARNRVDGGVAALRQPARPLSSRHARPRRQRARRPGRNDCRTRHGFMRIPIYERGVYVVLHDWRTRHVFRRLACEPNRAPVGAQHLSRPCREAAPQLARTVQFRSTLHEVT